MATTHEIKTCEVCGNRHLRSVLNLGLHPLCDDLVPVGDPRSCREYPIEILFCDRCATAHQRFQVPKRELFPQNYHYRSRFTADVLSGMRTLVDSCETRFGDLNGKTVVDIGCNDGSLLDFFSQKGAATIGIEPTEAAADAARKGHRIFHAFVSPDVATTIRGECGEPDFICFTNVFAHIENLEEVIASLKLMMGQKTILIIENHYLGSVLDRNQFDTFYHEHPRSYSYTSFAHIAASLCINLVDVEFPSRYGGNIRIFMGNAARHEFARASGELADREKNFAARFAVMNTNIKRWRDAKGAVLRGLVEHYGQVRGKAFPGRAAILIKLLGLNENSISAIYEKPGSMKIGHYVPGTRIPIRSDEELFNLGEQTLPLINFAWHISAEIRDYLSGHGYGGRIIDIMSAEDFSE